MGHATDAWPERMPKLSREERETIARRRLVRVLAAHTVANARTLEQKISDAGPNPQRVDPHILTGVRNAMVEEGRIVRINRANTPWFHLHDAAPKTVRTRLAEQLAIHQALFRGNAAARLGQTLEIATYRALEQLPAATPFFGRFTDLGAHGDDQLYSKEEPPQHIGRRSLVGKQRLDFLLIDPSGQLGIECKNVREWLYPDREEVRELLQKCLALDVVPVLIGRRIPFVTFRLLNACGVILHQTYNQLVPAADQSNADRARDKTLLGYHDLRTGNQPDARLLKFITKNMLAVAPGARAKFAEYQDLLEAFASGQMSYKSFAARVRRRGLGLDEDRDADDDDEGDPADWQP